MLRKVIFLPYAFDFPCFGFAAAGTGSLLGNGFAFSGDFLHLPSGPFMGVAVFFANSAYFSSDRTIQQYVDEIWKLEKAD